MPIVGSAVSPYLSRNRNKHKAAVRSTGGIVVSQNRAASEVGARVLKAGGHAVQLIEAEGRGPDRHSLSHVTYRLAAACAKTVASGKPAASLNLAPLIRLAEHVYAVPPESGYARIDDVDAVPVGEKGKPRYAHYLTLPRPKAFVVTEKGGWFFQSNSEDAMPKALGYCPAGTKCWLYAVDDQVVWKANREERIATVRPIGDPVDIPR